MEFQLLAMNDSVGLLILVVGMAVAVALIALLESKMNAPQPAASVPEERHAPAAARQGCPGPPRPGPPLWKPASRRRSSPPLRPPSPAWRAAPPPCAASAACPAPPVSRRGVWGEAGIAAVTTPFFVLTPANPRKSKALFAAAGPPPAAAFSVSRNSTRCKGGQQPRTAAPNASISPFEIPFDKILRQIAHSSLRSSHTICRKISLSVSPSSAHVRRRRRFLTFSTVCRRLRRLFHWLCGGGAAGRTFS